MYGAILFFQQNYVKDEILTSSYNENKYAALNSKVFIDEKTSHYNEELTLFATAVEELDFNQEEIHMLMRNYTDIKSSLYQIEILDSNKQVIDVYPENDLLMGMDRSLENTLMDIEIGDTYWTRPYIPHLDDKLVATVVTKTSSYYFIWFIELDFFDILYDEISDSITNKELTITDEFGVLIFSNDSEEVDSRIRLHGFDDLKQNNEETIIDDFDGKPSVITTYKSDETGWYIFVYEPYNQVIQTWLRVKNVFVIVGISIIATLALVQLLSYLIISKNLKYLITKIEDFKEDKLLGEIPLTSYKEFNTIRHAFNDMFEVINTSKEKLTKLAYKDTLTELYSRNYIEKLFIEGLENDVVFFTVYLNINRFKIINETFGYNFGNAILISVADRIKAFCQMYSCVTSRHEADKFMIYGEDLENDVVDSRIHTLLKLLEEDYSVGEAKIKLDISCVLVYEKSSTFLEFDKLVLACDVAMTKTKSLVDEKYVLFNNDMLAKFERKLNIEEAINDAFANKRFITYLQPIININTNEISGFEGLARLQSEKYGLIFPGEFIPLLESARKLNHLDQIIIRQSVTMCSTLNKTYTKDFILGVNASFETFSQPGFPAFITTLLEETKFNPKQLYIEITEESYIGDNKRVLDNIEALGSIGVNFSIDDFGDGYSSLSYISRLDVSCIKVSNYFVRGLLEDKRKLKLLSMILNLAQELQFKVIIEGVETKEVLEYLREKNIVYVQGYYFYKPLPYDEITDILRKQVEYKK
jgi:diguanylate cyclase (GGDEF)-like protein